MSSLKGIKTIRNMLSSSCYISAVVLVQYIQFLAVTWALRLFYPMLSSIALSLSERGNGLLKLRLRKHAGIAMDN